MTTRPLLGQNDGRVTGVSTRTMKAYRFVGWQRPPELRRVPVPDPGPGQVLIKVGGAGVCHSDLHLLDWPPGRLPLQPPFTLGHENAGWVERVGPGVEGLEIGDAVIVHGPWGCGRFRACRLSEENYCERADEIGAMGGGLGRDGGMAEYMLVPSARMLVPLGRLDPRDAAPLTDAALTPYHAVKRSLDLLHPGATAAVIGIGGLGHMALQILRAVTAARIVAIDRAAAKLRLAHELGADVVIPPGEATADAVRGFTGGRGCDVVLDVVGSDETLALAARLAHPQAHVTVLGLAGGTLPFEFFGLPLECSLATTYWGSAVELMEVVELAQRGAIQARVERYALDDVDEAFRRLRSGDLEGRAVICPHG